MITCEKVRQLFSYDKKVGLLIRKVRRSNQHIGTVAGRVGNHGAIVIHIEGRLYLAHRLIWLYVTGAFPKDKIDHINGDKMDNRWSNLRECTQAQNLCNTKLRSNNKTGAKGVHIHSQGRFRVQVKKGGVIVFDKLFDDLATAKQAAIDNRNKFHGQFARHR